MIVDGHVIVEAPDKRRFIVVGAKEAIKFSAKDKPFLELKNPKFSVYIRLREIKRQPNGRKFKK